MSGSPDRARPQAHEDGAGALLAALRSAGADRLDPLRFRSLQALAQRLDGVPPAARALLHERLRQAAAECAEHAARRRQAAATEAARLLAGDPALARDVRRLQATDDLAGLRRLALAAEARAGWAPLADLNRAVRAPASAAGDLPTGDAGEPQELASVQRFRRAWDSRRSLDQVAQATARRPTNAGPLNSHALVLESLDLMRELSTDYLRRFLLHVESLQWLAQAGEQQPSAGKAPKAGTAATPPAPRQAAGRRRRK